MTKPMVKKLQLGHARRLPVRPETIHQFMLNFITRTSRACQRMNIKAKLSYALKMIKNNVRMTKIIVEQPELDSKQIVTRSS